MGKNDKSSSAKDSSTAFYKRGGGGDMKRFIPYLADVVRSGEMV
jgi:hypothetical protein